jgi:hypothetical protein
MNNLHDSKEPPEFSLFLGGPLFQLLMRMRLTTPALDLLKKRMICITLFAWLPLLVLSLIDGNAWGGVGVPFLYDIEDQVRFLVALPLLIAAELLVHKRMRLILWQFLDQNIITEKVLPRFKELIASAMKLRNSVAFELFLLIVVFGVGNYLWSKLSVIEEIATGAGSWYLMTDNTGSHLTLAGYWYFFVSRPLFQFIILRWYYRLFIWGRFLWQTSRLELKLIPTHPDHAGGLGFLAQSSSALVPLVVAHGVLLAGLIANSIFFAGAKLPEFMLLIIGIVVFLLLIVLGPLLVFSAHLIRAKRTGLREYGILASKYVSEFDQKWVRGEAAGDERLLGSSDIQSLADMANSFQVIRNLQLFPFGKETLLQMIFCTLIPVLPLVLTMIPLEELIKKLFQAIL